MHDCRELSNGVLALRRRTAIALAAPAWSHVDGVLLFKLLADVNKGVGWMFDLVTNPNGHGLPEELLEKRPSEESWRNSVHRFEHMAHFDLRG